MATGELSIAPPAGELTITSGLLFFVVKKSVISDAVDEAPGYFLIPKLSRIVRSEFSCLYGIAEIVCGVTWARSGRCRQQHHSRCWCRPHIRQRSYVNPPSPPGWKSDVLTIGSSVPLIKLSAAANFCASEQEYIPTGQSWAS